MGLVHALFTTDEGQYFLSVVREATIEQPTYVPSPLFNGMPKDENLQGPWRDGLNTLVRTVEGWIAEAEAGGRRLT